MSVVLVTGASSGFGEAIALRFADAGHHVVATMRDPARAPQTLEDRLGLNFAMAPLDVTDEASRSEAVKFTLMTYGRLDILVNNAGIAPMAGFEDASPEFLRNVFETNYFGPCEMMRLVLPLFRAQGGGRIVNVTAIGAILTTPLMNAYCASKHAMDSTAAALDIEARPFGVRVASVLPGPYATAIGGKSPKAEASAPYQRMLDHMNKGRAAAPPAPSDLTPVVDAVYEAATASNPKTRYLVEAPGLADAVKGIMPEMERLHAFEARRAGVA